MAAFIAMTSWQGEFTDEHDEYFAQPAPDPVVFGMPTEDDGSRDDPLLSDRSWAVSSYRPDVDALAVAPTRVVIAVGEESLPPSPDAPRSPPPSSSVSKQWCSRATTAASSVTSPATPANRRPSRTSCARSSTGPEDRHRVTEILVQEAKSRPAALRVHPDDTPFGYDAVRNRRQGALSRHVSARSTGLVTASATTTRFDRWAPAAFISVISRITSWSPRACWREPPPEHPVSLWQLAEDPGAERCQIQARAGCAVCQDEARCWWSAAAPADAWAGLSVLAARVGVPVARQPSPNSPTPYDLGSRRGAHTRIPLMQQRPQSLA
jgi:hypothetical protein